MANSKYEYVKTFEQSTSLLPNTYMIVRIDGRGFHKLSAKYKFEKPNDRHALELMNAAATAVMKELPDITCAYGISDDFILDRSSRLFERRESKILTTVVSTFTSYYVHLWSNFFADKPLSPPMPSFDGRVVLYPSSSNLRDYMSWRQVDCHINNLYNTTFWSLVLKGGMDATQAENRLKGTIASEKNEILFSEFKMNYNNEAEIFKKGSIIYRDYDSTSSVLNRKASAPADYSSEKSELSKTQKEKERKRHVKASIAIEHTDIIRDEFWEHRPWLLSTNLDS
ncbi:tRNA-His guanylyltransferase [Imshaugia aleurites]|uniref:tRNA(His) guanylyltransferase n=1 Tax=Imshaugia aleurites TaxID=172621 RepID=A0A8H3INN0_9LECA|nr:tRNA-His guanylyltransferase [Imshaugia aleurites]